MALPVRTARSPPGVVEVMRRMGACISVCARYSKKPPLRRERLERRNRNVVLELSMAKRYRSCVGMKNVLSLE